MRPEADINANEVDAASPLKRPSNTSEEENVRDAPDDSKLTVADLSASLPLPKEAPAIHNEEELNERDLDDSMSRPLTNDHVPAIGNLSIKFTCLLLTCRFSTGSESLMVIPSPIFLSW